MDNVIFIKPTTCTNVNQTVNQYCLPMRISCNRQPIGGRIVLCGDEWNCQDKCQSDRQYFIPYQQGDKVQLQTLFYAGSQSSPAPYDSFITATICYADGTNNTVPISRKMSAWCDGKPFQIIEIDTTNLSTCWQVKLTYDGQDYCSQWYGLEDDCRSTIIIKSEGPDCFDYCYDKEVFVGDDIVYDNSMRVYGYIKYASTQITKERNDITGNVIRSISKDNFEVGTTGKMPPFMAQIFKQWMNSDEVIINGETYESDDVTLQNELTTRMQRYTFEVAKSCEVSTANLCK